MTKHFIVIGNPINHSKSPVIHQAFADQVNLDICYRRQYCPNDSDSFNAVATAFFNGGGIGANVTVPFKQVAYDLCQERLTPQATLAKAVNTLYMVDGEIHGDNTDGDGLVSHLHSLNWQLQGASVAIIGAGGASRGILLPLLLAGVDSIHIANRTVSKAQALIEDFQGSAYYQQLHNEQSKVLSYGSIEDLTGHYDLIINATSIGLSSQTLPLASDLSCSYGYDMMYGCTLPFLEHFAHQGASVSDGFGMLIGQAKLSFEKWTGYTINVDQLGDLF